MANNRPDHTPVITPECVKPLLETRYIRVYDLEYEPGKHYYDTTRRSTAELVALKSDEEAKTMLPDAVSCVVVLESADKEPMLLLSMEYRYPAGRFLLSVPAGLIDPEDRACPDALLVTAAREIREETGLVVGENDQLTVIAPFLYSTPGMTDESNALVGAHLHVDDLSKLTQEGAEGSECFDGFVLVTRAQARDLLMSGRDQNGHFYSVYTWMALSWFVAGF